MSLAYVAGVGMTTPVGWSSASSCAAIRSGISRFAESLTLFDRWGQPLVVAALPDFEDLSPDLDDVLGAALNEAAIAAGIPELDRATINVVAPLPSRPDSRFSARLVERFFSRLLTRQPHVDVRSFRQGAAGFGPALRHATDDLKVDPEVPQFIVGVDSLIEFDIVKAIEAEDRLKDSTRPRGLFPGEACGAIVLTTRRPTRPSCAILGIGMGREAGLVGSSTPNTAEGATDALRDALTEARIAAEDIGAAYLDLNGEEDKAHEWSLLWARMLHDLEVIHPADCIGDVGAATMPILVGTAATAWAKGYAPASHAVALAGSDDGLRACVILAASR